MDRYRATSSSKTRQYGRCANRLYFAAQRLDQLIREAKVKRRGGRSIGGGSLTTATNRTKLQPFQSKKERSEQLIKTSIEVYLA
jgi:lipopolysaccharide export system protein LptA